MGCPLLTRQNIKIRLTCAVGWAGMSMPSVGSPSSVYTVTYLNLARCSIWIQCLSSYIPALLFGIRPNCKKCLKGKSFINPDAKETQNPPESNAILQTHVYCQLLRRNWLHNQNRATYSYINCYSVSVSGFSGWPLVGMQPAFLLPATSSSVESRPCSTVRWQLS